MNKKNKKQNLIEDIDNIQGLENIQLHQIYKQLYNFIFERLKDNYIDIEISDLFIYGSRGRHTAKANSDLDVIVYYFGDEKENTIFNILNSLPKLKINNIEVDFNPIRPEESGDLKDYIQRSNEYDQEILSKINENKKKLEAKQIKYDPPYSLEEIKKNYDKETYEKLSKDPVHRWRAITGIELIHKEPSKDELDRIWINWNLMPNEMKEFSDKKSIELFGVDNETHYYQLQDEYDYFKSKDITDEDINSWRIIQKMIY